MTQVHRPSRWLLGLALMLLLLRAVVPAGWMPAQERGQWITICSGAGVSMAWIGADGKIDKEHAPAKSEKSSHCAFSGLGTPVDLAVDAFSLPLPPFAAVIVPMLTTLVTVGQGLAAPPPPKTGPPALI